MICKISINVTGTQAGNETSARYELTCHGDDPACAAQIQLLQEACLAAVAAEEGPALGRPVDWPRRPAQATPTLCQLARLYRAATNVACFDLAKLQDLCHKLYQKPLEELSMIEVGGVLGTLNAVVKGMIDVKHVLSRPQVQFHRYPARGEQHFRRLFAIIREYLDCLDSGRFTIRPGWGCASCEFCTGPCRAWAG